MQGVERYKNNFRQATRSVTRSWKNRCCCVSSSLKWGLLQLTDATTAERLLKEHGKDIRYIALWKKWIVWNGAYWEADSGALKGFKVK